MAKRKTLDALYDQRAYLQRELREVEDVREFGDEAAAAVNHAERRMLQHHLTFVDRTIDAYIDDHLDC